MIGRIYQIKHKTLPIVYIGATVKSLHTRFMFHRNSFKYWCKSGKCYISIYPHMKEHGIDQFDMELVKEYEIADDRHLRAMEQLWINKLANANKYNAFSFGKYPVDRERSRRNSKNYYQIHKKSIRATNAQKSICACGHEVSKGNVAHTKSKKHLNRMATIQAYS